jgi:hypothetical protein
MIKKIIIINLKNKQTKYKILMDAQKKFNETSFLRKRRVN